MKGQPTKQAQPSSDRRGKGEKQNERREGGDRRGQDDVFYVWYPSYDERDGERRKS